VKDLRVKKDKNKENFHIPASGKNKKSSKKNENK
jgi:hypothetical protein